MSEVKPLDRQSAAELEALYRRHAGWLARALKRRVGVEGAADLVQETYLRVAPQDLTLIRTPKAFLLRVAMNLLRDDARRTQRRETVHRDIAGPDHTLPVDAVLLKQILLAMPPLYRQVFVQSRFKGMTYEQIASAEGVSVKAIEWRMSKALEFCAERLDQ